LRNFNALPIKAIGNLPKSAFYQKNGHQIPKYSFILSKFATQSFRPKKYRSPSFSRSLSMRVTFTGADGANRISLPLEFSLSISSHWAL
jgi:hypothetical protein